jgi:hypothetical protein
MGLGDVASIFSPCFAVGFFLPAFLHANSVASGRPYSVELSTARDVVHQTAPTFIRLIECGTRKWFLG